MQQILIATDFSRTAQQASTYALGLATYLGARVELVHAYILPFAYTDTPVPLMNLEEVQAISAQSMTAETERLQGAFPEVILDSRSVPGELSEVLEERIGQLKPDLVVLGTSGEGGMAFFGSMAVKTMRHCRVPVLAVPEGVQWAPVHRICFAADYKEDNPVAPLVMLSSWLQRMRSALYVFHLNEPEAPVLQVPVALKNQFEEQNVQYFSETGTDLEATIQAFIAGNAIDWLVVIPKKYGFFERLFHRSKTKQLTLGSRVPVLALHDEMPED